MIATLQARIAQTYLQQLGFYSGAIDGLWGDVSQNAAETWLERTKLPPLEPAPQKDDEGFGVTNPRTMKYLATLDPKAQPAFRKFIALASAEAYRNGCDYTMISGYRTWDEQADLYRKHQDGGPHASPAGYSMHNFKIAGDFGVFKGGTYLDDGTPAQQAFAEKIHHGCGALAASCGLIWGGKWSGGSHDDPHYQIDIGHATPTDSDRARFKATGSILS